MRTKITTTLILSTIISSILLLIVGGTTLVVTTAFLMLLDIVAMYDITQKKHKILRNFPVIGHGRWFAEKIRPELRQYFIETDTNGEPFNRETRSRIYQFAKNEKDTIPFGTKHNVYEKGHEYVNHSMFPINMKKVQSTRFDIGTKFTTQPYNSSLVNISAMSFGSLSPTAVSSNNLGAKLGNFAQNTGEGGVARYHTDNGGDLIWQIGTGYFGARNNEGGLDRNVFAIKSKMKNVKMIEVKLSQGAKPGHGGILPASKNNKEISEIRGVEEGTKVVSPSSHKEFSNPTEMMEFISELRTLSGGKPIGIKLCVSDKNELENLIRRMNEMDMYPDFITVDGSEGGTGAAPLEFTNSMGTPLRDAVYMTDTLLKKYNLRKEIKIIGSGRITNGFDIIKIMALGADGINMARGFMFALGCIQALECHKNTCPVGIATQNKSLYSALDVEVTGQRAFNFHKNTIHMVREMMASMGVNQTSKLNKKHINVRMDVNITKTYDELYF